ncbi:MAG: alpha/beta hydrolase [Spirochaetes bacterium]|nr:alpha/beta hydrolase [Spirochaetota bacterium]
MMKPRFYAIVLLFFAALALTEAGCKNRYLFHPYKQIVDTPASMGLVFDDVYFNAADGIRINAWWVPAPAPKGTILFCHGNAGNISFLLDTIRLFHGLKLNVLVFDYRGFGRSGGSATEEGTYRDVAAAWEYLVSFRKIDPGTIAVIGRSLGGPIAAWICQDRTPGALVLEATFTRAADVALHHYPMAPGELLFGDTYNAGKYVTRVRCPVLVVHSPEDEIIPYDLGAKLFKKINGPKEFLMIRGSHNNGFMESLNEYASGLDWFLVRHLKKGSQP